MPLEGGDAIIPPLMEQVLPSQIVQAAVILRRFLHSQLQ